MVCRWQPPQASILMVPAPPPRVGVTPQPFSTFPVVRPDMWCGAFQRKFGAAQGVAVAVGPTLP